MSKIKQTRILMFSGGMDSFILKTLYSFKDTECLFINLNTKENKIENQYIDRYFPNTIKISLPLNQFELTGTIPTIPFRNNILSLIGAQYGSNIYFAFTAGDSSKDTDYVFKSQMESILNYFGQDENKTPFPPPYKIKIPFRRFTKTQLIAMFLEKKGDPLDLLTKTVSCYKGDGIPCGECRSCIRNYISYKLNNISLKNYMKKTPSISVLQNFLNESVSKKNENFENLDINNCLGLLKKEGIKK